MSSLSSFSEFVRSHWGLVMVAIGVIGEVTAEWKEPNTKWRHVLLRISSIVLIAGLLREFKETINEEKDVADTRLKYEELKAATDWRELTKEQHAKLVSALSVHPSSVLITTISGNNETDLYALNLNTAFVVAGWDTGHLSGTYDIPPMGIVLSGRDPVSIAHVANALKAGGIAFSEAQAPSPSSYLAPDDGFAARAAVTLVVGMKPREVRAKWK